MKTALLVLSLLGTAAAFGQQPAAPVSHQPQSYQSPSHPQHASEQSLAPEHYLFGAANYFSVRGDARTWDLPPAPTKSLGESARLLREEHGKLKKARVVFEN
jgi:hypothetical protein